MRQINNEIVTIIQARTASKRLPNKILLKANGKELLSLMLERVRRAELCGRIVVATTTGMEDDIIVNLCIRDGFDYFRGDPFDLLDRHYKAAKQFSAGIVLKIPSDCPLIDPSIIDRVISYYLENENRYDYVSNLHPASYPDGNDVEIFSFEALEKAWHEAAKQYEREHTTPYLWDNPEKFRKGNVKWESGNDLSFSHRWTLDYYEDYLFIKSVFEYLYSSKPDFGLDDILRLTKDKPELTQINDKHKGTNWFLLYKDELKTLNNELI